ncbi:MAG: hypothetical protein ACE5KX_01630 [Acidimicrobiia bacterium]
MRLTRSGIGLLLLGIGAALIVVGVIGQALGGNGGGAARATSAPPGPAPPETTTTEPEPTTTTAPEPTTTTTTIPEIEPETIEAFYAALVAALKADEPTLFMFERLHPAVVDRYGPAACRAYLDGLKAPESFDLQVLGVGPPVPWAYATDRQSDTIDDAMTVRLLQSLDEESSEIEAHVVVREGLISWFTDCGEPAQS